MQRILGSARKTLVTIDWPFYFRLSHWAGPRHLISIGISPRLRLGRVTHPGVRAWYVGPVAYVVSRF